MKVFLQAFLHIVYTSDKKMEFFKDKKIWSEHIWVPLKQRKREVTFAVVLALDLGNLPEKSLVFI